MVWSPDTSTELYGIIGHPVAHSLSPAMHNRAFRFSNINAVYLAFDVVDLASAMGGVRSLGIKGLSVTIPHKESIMPFLDEIDSMASRIGAVNTVVNKGNKLVGFNTDWLGAVRALEEVTDLRGKNILVLGAGGSARAVCVGLRDRGASVHVANRTVEKARVLAQLCDGAYSGLDELDDVSNWAEILVNTTSVGMLPDGDRSLVPEALLSRFKVVMDLVYSPIETKLLVDAKNHGCKVISGLKMLLYQAISQFELWTGQSAPVQEMEKVLLDAMT